MVRASSIDTALNNAGARSSRLASPKKRRVSAAGSHSMGVGVRKRGLSTRPALGVYGAFGLSYAKGPASLRRAESLRSDISLSPRVPDGILQGSSHGHLNPRNDSMDQVLPKPLTSTTSPSSGDYAPTVPTTPTAQLDKEKTEDGLANLPVIAPPPFELLPRAPLSAEEAAERRISCLLEKELRIRTAEGLRGEKLMTTKDLRRQAKTVDEEERFWLGSDIDINESGEHIGEICVSDDDQPTAPSKPRACEKSGQIKPSLSTFSRADISVSLVDIGVDRMMLDDILKWFLEVMPSDEFQSSYVPGDLYDVLSTIPAVRFHAGHLFLRYFWLAGTSSLCHTPDSEDETDEDAKTALNVVTWDIAIACLAISIKFHRDVLYPLDIIYAHEYLALAPHELGFEDLENAQRDVLEAIEFRIASGSNPDAYMAELWQALPMLRQLVGFNEGWARAQEHAWDVLCEALQRPEVLQYPTSILTALAIMEGVLKTLTWRYKRAGVDSRGKTVKKRDSKSLRRIAVKAAKGVKLDIQDVLRISDEEWTTCQKWSPEEANSPFEPGRPSMGSEEKIEPPFEDKSRVEAELTEVDERLRTQADSTEEPSYELEYVPDGGKEAWTVVLGSSLALFASAGMINAYGAFQTYYKATLLPSSSSASISLIGSLQVFFLYFLGTFTGRTFDAYGTKYMIPVGSFLCVFGLMMVSLCQKDQAYQVVLSQGVLFGIGIALLLFYAFFIPYFYIQAYANFRGVSPHVANYLLPILNAMNVPSRIIPGYIADRIGPLKVFIPAATICSVLILGLWLPSRNEGAIVAFSALYGLFSGSVYMVVAVATLVGTPTGGALLKQTDEQHFNDLIIFCGVMTLAGTAFLASLRFALSVLLSYHLYALIANHTAGEGPVHDYAIGSGIGSRWLGTLVLLWFCDPLKEWRYGDEKVAPAEYPILKRLYYTACILGNPRLIGWSAQVANIPPPKAASSRGEFLRDRILRAVQCVLLLDFAQSYMQLQPFFRSLGTDAFPTGLRGFAVGFLCRLAWYVRPYATVKLACTVLAIICVAASLFNGNPEDWRPAFGDWSDAYTVRRFWGYAFGPVLQSHVNNVLTYFTITGRTIANALGFKRGTNASAYTQLYTGFALSGMMHVWGDVMLGTPYIGNSMKFFLANACAITVEDAVIAVGRRMFGLGREPTKWTIRLGYFWVIAWFYVVGPLYVDWFVQVPGVTTEEFLPFSLLRSRYPPSLLTSMMQYTF
ncbi:hypothetical protein ACG7TL_001865 [Trametes sanguinea]